MIDMKISMLNPNCFFGHSVSFVVELVLYV